MKKLLPLFSFLLLFSFACEDDEIESYDVLVKVSRRNINIWAFGIWVNNNQIFSVSECEANNPSSAQCVDFTDFYLGGYAYNYEFSAKKGDEISVLVVPLDGCYSSVSAWIYVDNKIKESVIEPCEDDDCNDCCCSSITCEYTIE